MISFKEFIKEEVTEEEVDALIESLEWEDVIHLFDEEDMIIEDISAKERIKKSQRLKSRKVFIICEGKDFKAANIPSDLQGYFISFYEIKNKKAIFHDNNSLAMSIVSEIADKFNKSYVEDEK
jgi:hypothetical protein